MSSYAEKIREYLGKVAEIVKTKPAYKQPGDGSDGTCDCIGLLIGAIRRIGLKWSGIHGSNYAARKQVNGLAKIGSIDELELGDAVFKAYEKGEKGWDLPGRYWQGKAYYNGDLRDYYHVGTVTKKSPGMVEITHMSGPGILTLTARSMKQLGKWGFHGKLKPIVAASDDGVTPKPAPTPAPAPEQVPIPSAGSRAAPYSCGSIRTGNAGHGCGCPSAMRSRLSAPARHGRKSTAEDAKAGT